MTDTTTEYWDWNGTSLNQPQWNIATWGGTRMSAPVLRGQNYEVPYLAGQVQRPKFPNSRTVSLVMWAAGIDGTTGNPSADQLLTWNDNWNQLRRLFYTRDHNGSTQGKLTRRWYITQSGSPQIVAATALAEVAGDMQPKMTGRYRADFTVDLLLADPYFYGAEQSQTISIGNPTTITNLGEGVAGEGSAGIFTAKFTGPMVSPVLTNTTAGVSVWLAATLPSGYSVTLDFVAASAQDSSGVSQVGQVRHSGARNWFALWSGANTVELSTGNSTDSGSVLLSWQPPYE